MYYKVPNFTYNSFIYCWINLENNKKYIGSHWGIITDSYIGSGIIFRKVYDKNPNKFIRLILEYCYCKDVNDLRENYEQKWLNSININSNEFYNISNNATGWPSGNLNPSRINPNFLGKKHTEETKRKISEAKKGKKLSLQTINNIKESFRINGHPIKNTKWIHKNNINKLVKPEFLESFLKDGWILGQSEEMIKNCAVTGWKQTDYQKKTVAEKLSKKYLITYPNGNIEEIINLRQFCIKNNLDQGNMTAVSKGRLKQHKGFRCKLIS